MAETSRPREAAGPAGDAEPGLPLEALGLVVSGLPLTAMRHATKPSEPGRKAEAMGIASWAALLAGLGLSGAFLLWCLHGTQWFSDDFHHLSLYGPSRPALEILRLSWLGRLAPQGDTHYAPLSNLVSLVLYRLDDPGLAHALRLPWHLSSAALVYAIGRRHAGQAAALFGALTFALWPGLHSSLHYVASTGDLMCTSFTLLALWAWLSQADAPWPRRLGPTLAAWSLALLSKEMTLPFPALLILLSWLQGRLRRDARQLAALFLTGALFLSMRVGILGHWGLSEEDSFGSLFRASSVVGPLKNTLALLVPLPRSLWMSHPWSLLSALPLLLLLAVHALRRPREAAVSLTVLVMAFAPVLDALSAWYRPWPASLLALWTTAALRDLSGTGRRLAGSALLATCLGGWLFWQAQYRQASRLETELLAAAAQTPAPRIVVAGVPCLTASEIYMLPDPRWIEDILFHRHGVRKQVTLVAATGVPAISPSASIATRSAPWDWRLPPQVRRFPLVETPLDSLPCRARWLAPDRLRIEACPADAALLTYRARLP